MNQKKDEPTLSVIKNTSKTEFTCACEVLVRSSCKHLSFYKEHEGKSYCVLHYPNKEKSEEFNVAMQAKLDAKDFDFCGVWFPPQVDFNEYEFTGDANFHSAVFIGDAYFVSTVFKSAANFTLASFNGTAYFSGSVFNAADFTWATFNVTDFISTTFNAYAYFMSATFEGDTDFTSAVFGAETSFRAATFLKTVLFVKSIHKRESVVFFPLTTFSDLVKFQECDFESAFPLNLEGAIFEKPERVIFHTVMLDPHWLVNVDPRKFSFIDVRWGTLTKKAIAYELHSLRRREVSTPHRLLAIAYRQLAVNAEDNNRYREAARFRQAAMQTRSLEIRRSFSLFFRNLRVWLRVYGPLKSLIHRWYRLSKITERRFGDMWESLDPLHSLYGFASGYGESVGRASLVLIVVWIVFAIAYWQGDMTWWQQKTDNALASQTEQVQPQIHTPLPLTLGGALIYSSGVIILQKPEPQPANKRGKIIVMLETIIGPLQAALLALAVRRKFMR